MQFLLKSNSLINKLSCEQRLIVGGFYFFFSYFGFKDDKRGSCMRQAGWSVMWTHPSQGESKGERRRERVSGVVSLRDAVHCGCALRCSGVAMVTSSSNQSWEPGVWECESAYPTSTLIITARETRQHLTPQSRETPNLSSQRGADVQWRSFEKGECGSELSNIARGKI